MTRNRGFPNPLFSDNPNTPNPRLLEYTQANGKI